MRKFCLMLLLLGVYVLKGQQFTWTALPDHTYPDSLHHPFILGVASSEPDTAAVYIWTYAEPDSFTQVSMPFNWEFSADSGFSSVLFSGSVAADSNSSWTRTIHVTGLAPDTYYWYRFNDGRGNYSVTGRTRTLPTNSNNIRLVVSSCSNIRAYYNAYARIAELNNISAVMHLGDWAYDSPTNNGAVRAEVPLPTGSTDCDLYKRRMRDYMHLLDPDLRR